MTCSTFAGSVTILAITIVPNVDGNRMGRCSAIPKANRAGAVSSLSSPDRMSEYIEAAARKLARNDGYYWPDTGPDYQSGIGNMAAPHIWLEMAHAALTAAGVPEMLAENERLLAVVEAAREWDKAWTPPATAGQAMADWKLHESIAAFDSHGAADSGGG